MASTVSEWIGPILTSGSVLIATLTYRKSVKEKKAERRENEKHQASRVHAWLKDSLVPLAYLNNDNESELSHNTESDAKDAHLGEVYASDGTEVVMIAWPYSPSIRMLNSSTEPVYNFRVRLRWDAIVIEEIVDPNQPAVTLLRGQYGLNLMDKEKLVRVEVRCHDWEPWGGEGGQWAQLDFGKKLGLDTMPTTVSPMERSSTFPLDEEFKFARAIALHPDDHGNPLKRTLVAIVATVESIKFADSLGRNWIRSEFGTLERDD